MRKYTCESGQVNAGQLCKGVASTAKTAVEGSESLEAGIGGLLIAIHCAARLDNIASFVHAGRQGNAGL